MAGAESGRKCQWPKGRKLDCLDVPIPWRSSISLCFNDREWEISSLCLTPASPQGQSRSTPAAGSQASAGASSLLFLIPPPWLQPGPTALRVPPALAMAPVGASGSLWHRRAEGTPHRVSLPGDTGLRQHLVTPRTLAGGDWFYSMSPEQLCCSGTAKGCWRDGAPVGCLHHTVTRGTSATLCCWSLETLGVPRGCLG